MRKISLAMLLTVGVVFGRAAVAQDAGSAKVILGPLTVEQLIDLPDWFGAEFIGYIPEARYADELPSDLGGATILCVMGTWCDDSKREVPRLIRLMQIKGVTPEKLTMIGADRNKMTPGGEHAIYQIEKVPTFIFLRDGNEIGRIVESPTHSMERDILAILQPDAAVLKVRAQPAMPPEHHQQPHHPPEPPPPTDAANPADGEVK